MVSENPTIGGLLPDGQGEHTNVNYAPRLYVVHTLMTVQSRAAILIMVELEA